MYDYAHPLSKTQALVCLLDRLELHPSLASDIRAASSRYGFTFVDLSAEPPPAADNYLVRHLIIVDGCDFPESVTRSYEPLLTNYSSATIAMRYSSDERLRQASPVVDRLKIEKAGRINYLLPSATPHGYAPSLQKLVDNSICDSVRIKYLPKHREHTLAEQLPKKVAGFFTATAELFDRHNLFHRAPTDGFISIRAPVGGFYISCTRTDKCKMPLDRIAHVHRYTAATNVLEYSGAYLPSSDAVEAATFYDRIPWVHAIVHTHASRLLTRNPEYRHKIAVPPSSYGQAGLGEDIAAFVDRTGTNDFVILEDHGEFIFGTASDPSDCVSQVNDLITSAMAARA